MIDQTLDLALDYLKAHPNWYIFPLTRLEKAPPHISDELNLASNDPKQIRDWHMRWRGCNWGLSPRKSGLIIMDVDIKKGKIGQETLDNLTLEYGELPETYTVTSPTGGPHYYFEGKHKFGLGKHGFGVDIDSPNYVLIPGCWLCSNSERGYEVLKDRPIAPAPAWFGIFLKDKAERAQAESDPAVDLDKEGNIDRMIKYLKEGAPPSIQGKGGEKVLFDVAAVLKDNAISQGMAVQLLKMYYNIPGKCDPLWNIDTGPDADRLDVKVANAWQYAKENQAGTATAEFEFSGDPFTAADVAAMEGFKKMWDKLIKTQIKAKNFSGEEIKEERINKKFTDEARGIDGLTGEPFEDSEPVIDPVTGEQWGGLNGEKDPPPDPKPPAGSRPKAEEGGSDGDKDEPDSEETERQGNASGTPKSRQLLDWVQANWVWVVNAERFMRLKDGLMWSVKQFDSYYNNLTNKASMSNALFSTDTIRKIERLVYRPGKDMLLDNFRCVNLWRASKVKPKEGDTSIWNEHLNYLFQNEDDKAHVLNWMGWVYQNIGKKPNHGLLIVGRGTGTGKSVLARVLEQLIGPENTQRPKNSSLKGDFNAWALQCKLCIIEELMQIGRREVANELRDTITESTIEVNVKQISAQKIENYMAMMAITNHRDAMPMDEMERRWLVIETFVTKKGGDYYDRLWSIFDNPDALAAIAYELQNRKLGHFQEGENGERIWKKYNALLSPTETKARAQMIDLSRSDVETWLYDHIGSQPLCRKLLMTQDVIDSMPPTLQRQSRLNSTIRTFLRDKLRGELIGRSVRFPNGERKRLWALHGSITLHNQASDKTLADNYETERRNGGTQNEASDDFAEG